MKTSEVVFSENQIIIIGIKSPLFTRIPLLVIGIIAILIPIAILILRGIEGSGFHFGFIIPILVCASIAYFILRTVLWNTFGKEIITFTKEGIIYQPDYKYFKGKEMVVYKSPDLQFSRHNKEKDSCLFTIDNEESSIENVLPISKYHLRKIQQEFDRYVAND
ncbi:MAG: hypothetical protein AAF611_10050 [Bacteroidota bacterium]